MTCIIDLLQGTLLVEALLSLHNKWKNAFEQHLAEPKIARIPVLWLVNCLASAPASSPISHTSERLFCRSRERSNPKSRMLPKIPRKAPNPPPGRLPFYFKFFEASPGRRPKLFFWPTEHIDLQLQQHRLLLTRRCSEWV